MMRSRFMFAPVILLLVSWIATAQAQSGVKVSSADLVKAVIRSDLSLDVTEVHWKYLLLQEVNGEQQAREVVAGPFMAPPGWTGSHEHLPESTFDTSVC